MKAVTYILIGLIFLGTSTLSLKAQPRPGTLQGVVTDQKTGEVIPFVNIVIKTEDGKIISGGASDLDGNYEINPISAGVYNVEVSVLGYASVKLLKINIRSNVKTYQDFKLVESVECLDEVVISYEAPLIDKSRSSKSFSAESIKELAVRGIGSESGTFAPGISTDAFGAVVRGARADGSVYYVDGVKINNELRVRRAITPPKTVITGGPAGMIGDQTTIRKEYGVDFISPTKIKFHKDVPSTKTDGVSSSTLTAGEVNDFAKWNLWEDFSTSDFEGHKRHWDINPAERYSVQLSFAEGTPVVNAVAKLMGENGKTIWTARTDNTGKCELWANMHAESNDEPSEISVDYNSRHYKIDKPKTFEKGLNLLEINQNCQHPDAIDISFVVDATGSMGDEIAYLKAELNDVMLRVKATLQTSDLNLSSVFYRDKNDLYITRKSDFSSNIDKTVDFIKDQSAQGGGDYPEAVIEALDVAINQLSWREDAVTRIIFLVLDAPPHHSAKQLKQIHQLLMDAAKKGIRIIPIASSGINKSTEYLLRTMALTTNGTYTFLTDDSGVGNPHIKPSTDSYDVELLNDLMVRLIHQFSFVPDCKPIDNKVADKDSTNVNTSTNDFTKNEKPQEEDDLGWDVYPNPSNGEIQVDLRKKVDVLYLTDLHGKIVSKWEMDFSRKAVLDLSGLPSGTYFFRFMWHDRWFNEQIILAH